MIKSGSQDLITGDSSYSLPLVTVAGRNNLDFPLAISYGSGIRVDQEASWVGLGWSLGPGMISRSIIQEADDDPDYGYLNPTSPTYDLITKRGDLGGAQDNYFISFGAGGGRFILNNSGQAVMEHWKPWRIDYIKAADGQIKSWVVTTQDGTKYYFDIGLTTQTTQQNIYHLHKTVDNTALCPAPQPPCYPDWELIPGSCRDCGSYECGYDNRCLRGGRECQYQDMNGCYSTRWFYEYCNPGGSGSPILLKEDAVVVGESILEKLESAVTKERAPTGSAVQNIPEGPIYNFEDPDEYISPRNPIIPFCRDMKWPLHCFNATGEFDNIQIHYRIYEPSVSCQDLPKTKTYTSSWLLTKIVSHDYVDLSSNGPTDDDYGNWINFSYTDNFNQARLELVSPTIVTGASSGFEFNLTPVCYWYQQRNWAGIGLPSTWNNYIAGQGTTWWSNPPDCEYSNGNALNPSQKFRYTSLASTSSVIPFRYLSQILTPTHKATFDLSNRDDIRTDAINGGTIVPAKKLEKIILYKRTGPLSSDVVALQVINLTYGIESEELAKRGEWGKLTLKKVFTKTFDESEELPPYEFDYAYNPPYNPHARDSWGFYNGKDSNSGGFCKGFDNPIGPSCNDFDNDASACSNSLIRAGVSCFYENNLCNIRKDLTNQDFCAPPAADINDPNHECWGWPTQQTCELTYGCRWGRYNFNHGQGPNLYFCHNDGESPQCGINNPGYPSFPFVAFRYDCTTLGYNLDSCTAVPGCSTGIDVESTQDSWAWSLTNVTFPTKGKVHYIYESDDYRYLQTNELSTNKLGGGIRIKSVIEDNGINEKIQTTYSYKLDATKSSGVATLVPNITKNDLFGFSNVAPNLNKIVMYSKVTIDNPSNYGKTEIEYYTAKDQGHQDTLLDSQNRPHADRSWKRGMTKKQTMIGESGQVISATQYGFSFEETTTNPYFTAFDKSSACIGEPLGCNERPTNKCTGDGSCQIVTSRCTGPVAACWPRSPTFTRSNICFYLDSHNCTIEYGASCQWVQNQPCTQYTNRNSCTNAGVCYWSNTPTCSSINPIIGCQAAPSESACDSTAGCKWLGDEVKYSGWSKLLNVTTSQEGDINTGIKKITNYSYTPRYNGLPSTIIETNSDGIRKKTVVSYQHNYNSEPVGQDAVAKNMLTLPKFINVYDDISNKRVQWAEIAYKDYNPSFKQIYPWFEKGWLNLNSDDSVSDNEKIIVSEYIDYDTYGNLLEFKDASLRTSKTFFGSNNNPCSNSPSDNQFFHALVTCTENTNGQKLISQYNQDGALLTVNDSNGNIIRYEYDTFKRLYAEHRPGDDQTLRIYTYYYGPPSQSKLELISFQDQNSYLIAAEFYDGLGKKTNASLKTLDQEIFTNFIYDHAGKLIKITEPFYRGTIPYAFKSNVYESSPLARLNEARNYGYQDSPALTFTYGKSSNHKTELTTDEENKKIMRYYDALGQVKKVDTGYGSAVQSSTLFYYDVLGRTINITDPNLKNITNTFDTLGRLVKTVDPDTGIVTFQYDNSNNLLIKNDNGLITNYDYDNLDRITKKSSSGYPDIILIYDDWPTNTITECGEIISENNTQGRVLIKKVSGEIIECYQYDQRGMPIKHIIALPPEITQGSSTSYFTTYYYYNFKDKITRVIYPNYKGITYGYNSLGQLFEAASDNYLFNPSFEINNNNNNIPDSWSLWGSVSNNRYESNPTNVRFGSKSYYFESSTQNSGIYQGIPVIDNKPYLLSVWLKGTGLTNNRIKVKMEDDHSGEIALSTITLSNSWQLVTLPFISSCSGSSIECTNVVTFYHYSGSPLKVYIDGAKIEPGTTYTQFDANYYYYTKDSLLDSIAYGNNILSDYRFNNNKQIINIDVGKPQTASVFNESYDYYKNQDLKRIYVNLDDKQHLFYDDQRRLIQDTFDASYYNQAPVGAGNYNQEFQYDLAGNIINKKLKRINTGVYVQDDQYIYDTAKTNRLQQITSSGLETNNTIFTYDNKGNILSAQIPPFSPTTYTYNSNNQLSRVNYPSGYFTEFKYNADGYRFYKYDSITNERTIFIRDPIGKVLMEFSLNEEQ